METKDNFKTVRNHVVIKEIKQGEEKTASGLVIPVNAKGQKSYEKGVVVAVGPGAEGPDGKYIPTTLKVGDVVLYMTKGLDHFKHGSEIYRITVEPYVLAVVEE